MVSLREPQGLDRAALLAVAGLLAFSVLTRLPFFYPAVISWDESTFILMGQELLDGRLPYVELWDLKPPLAFAWFSAAIALLGKSIEAVRLAGALAVFGCGVFVLLIGRRMTGPACAWFAALVSIAAMGAVTDGQATLTEHFATLSLCAALYVLATGNRSLRRLVVGGILLSVATLTRTNLAYVAIAVVAATALHPWTQGVRHRLEGVAALGVGGLTPVMVCVTPYLLAGEFPTFYHSVIAAPLAYANGQLSGLAAAAKLGSGLLNPQRLIVPLILLLGAAGMVGIAWRFFFKRSATDAEFWTLLFGASATLSVVVSGAGHGHYLIQLVPLYAVASLALAARLGSAVRVAAPKAFALILAAGLALALVPTVQEYGRLFAKLRQNEPLKSGRALLVAEYIRTHNRENEPVYLLQDHVAYWLTGTRPLTRMTTHPSNIVKLALIRAVEGPDSDALGEMHRVLRVQPRFIVKSAQPWYLNAEPAVLQLLEESLDAEYRKVATIDDLEVFERVRG